MRPRRSRSTKGVMAVMSVSLSALRLGSGMLPRADCRIGPDGELQCPSTTIRAGPIGHGDPPLVGGARDGRNEVRVRGGHRPDDVRATAEVRTTTPAATLRGAVDFFRAHAAARTPGRDRDRRLRAPRSRSRLADIRVDHHHTQAGLGGHGSRGHLAARTRNAGRHRHRRERGRGRRASLGGRPRSRHVRVPDRGDGDRRRRARQRSAAARARASGDGPHPRAARPGRRSVRGRLSVSRRLPRGPGLGAGPGAALGAAPGDAARRSSRVGSGSALPGPRRGERNLHAVAAPGRDGRRASCARPPCCPSCARGC